MALKTTGTLFFSLFLSRVTTVNIWRCTSTSIFSTEPLPLLQRCIFQCESRSAYCALFNKQLSTCSCDCGGILAAKNSSTTLVLHRVLPALISMPLSKSAGVENYGSLKGLSITKFGDYGKYETQMRTYTGESEAYLRFYPEGASTAVRNYISIDVNNSAFHSADTGVGKDGLLFAIWIQFHKLGQMPLVEFKPVTDFYTIHTWLHPDGNTLYLHTVSGQPAYSIKVYPKIGEWTHLASRLSPLDPVRQPKVVLR